MMISNWPHLWFKNPFFTLHPTIKHFQDLFELTMFARWAWNTLFIATVLTTISLFCGLLAW